MPDPRPDPRSALQAQIDEIIRVQKAMLEAIKELEKEQFTNLMPGGEYHGIKFE